jgi:hypothetical protein
MSHSEYAEMIPTIMEVRPLGRPAVNFGEAVSRFEDRIQTRRLT